MWDFQVIRQHVLGTRHSGLRTLDSTLAAFLGPSCLFSIPGYANSLSSPVFRVLLLLHCRSTRLSTLWSWKIGKIIVVGSRLLAFKCEFCTRSANGMWDPATFKSNYWHLLKGRALESHTNDLSFGRHLKSSTRRVSTKKDLSWGPDKSRELPGLLMTPGLGRDWVGLGWGFCGPGGSNPFAAFAFAFASVMFCF